MKGRLRAAVLGSSCVAMALLISGSTLVEQNQSLFREMQAVHGLSDGQVAQVQAIFSDSGFIGQGNPAITKHPTTPAECREELSAAGVSYGNAGFDAICGGPFMAPLYDPSRETPEDAPPASTSSSFRTSPVCFRSSGCGLARRHGCVRRSESASAMPTNGKEHARAP